MPIRLCERQSCHQRRRGPVQCATAPGQELQGVRTAKPAPSMPPCENAVKIQIYTAIIAYVTVAIMKEQLKLKHSNYEILQILSITLLNKTPVNQLFQDPCLQDVKELEHNQLIMF